jgi:hypothetical protein
MPKTKATPGESTPGMGHNGLSEDDKVALFLSHLQTGRADNNALALAMEAVKAVRKIRNKNRNIAMNDGFSLALLDEIYEDETKGKGLAEREAERRWMREVAGLPVGTQLDLLKDTPAEVKDEIAAEADGYQAGIRGADPKPPTTIHPRHHGVWTKGYHDGVARNGKALERSKEIAIARGPTIHPIDEETGDYVEGKKKGKAA